MSRLFTIVHLTLHEALRRRILLATLLGALAFLVLYAVAFHFVGREAVKEGPAAGLQHRLILYFFTIAGLYATNFLVVLTAVLLPLDTLSGEISSGVMQTMAARPVRRAEIVLGKWLAYWLVCACYLFLVAGGVLAIAWFRSGILPPNPLQGIACMLLEATCFVSLSIAGGTRLSTVTNGIVGFACYGVAFLGGWIETIGSLANNPAARNVGTVASLIVPTEAMWQLAAHVMQPRVMVELHVTPFSSPAVPSPAMVWWAAGWALAVLLFGLRGMAKRGL